MSEPTPAAVIDPETTWRESASMAARGTGDGYTIAAYPNICKHIRGLIAEMERDNG